EGHHLDILYKEHLEKLRLVNAAPTFNTHLHRLESLCHQTKMNYASASFDNRCKFLLTENRKPKTANRIN
ncbi:MAG TPA: hypothetical protein VJA64_00120, partial [Desulfobaccales bacterium]|nr:hypothetical protein [Desulfobaccales bacterium]